MAEPPVELAAPDIARWRGDGPIPWVATRESGRPGPHLMILALVHGNEISGAIALDRLLGAGFRPAAGTVSLGFANVAAYRRFDPARPTEARYVDEDFNRVWDAATLDGRRRSIELERARALRPLVDRVDYLLDLHSMQTASAPLTLAGLTGKGLALARRIGAPALIVQDAGHAAGRRLRDYGRFADPAVPAAAALVECGQHWAAGSAVLAHEVALRFLDAFGALAPWPTLAPPPAQRVLQVTEAVTVASDGFRFLGDFSGLEVIARAGTAIAEDGGRAVLTPYDDCVLVMPSRRLLKGQTAVRLGRYVG